MGLEKTGTRGTHRTLRHTVVSSEGCQRQGSACWVAKATEVDTALVLLAWGDG
jgi:siroheme synthase